MPSKALRARLEAALLLTALALLLFVAGDWLTWRMRSARGEGTGQVTVTRVVVAPLKGNKEEYYSDGTDSEPCSRSILPWGGMRACWWVERQHLQVER